VGCRAQFKLPFSMSITLNVEQTSVILNLSGEVTRTQWGVLVACATAVIKKMYIS
jgi:hypothetical protein